MLVKQMLPRVRHHPQVKGAPSFAMMERSSIPLKVRGRDDVMTVFPWHAWSPRPQRFQEVGGRCEACGELIGDGTDWRRAIYHHTRLVSDPNVSDKEARAAANCMVLHPACHDDPVEFYNYPDNWSGRAPALLALILG